jgi:hypothetical protein
MEHRSQSGFRKTLDAYWVAKLCFGGKPKVAGFEREGKCAATDKLRYRSHGEKKGTQLVPTEGVEPTHSYEYQILSLARLPIPPHRPPVPGNINRGRVK